MKLEKHKSPLSKMTDINMTKFEQNYKDQSPDFVIKEDDEFSSKTSGATSSFNNRATPSQPTRDKREFEKQDSAVLKLVGINNV